MNQLQFPWFEQLIQDCKEIIFEGQKNVALSYWRLGKRIIEDELKFEKPEYGNKKIINLADELGRGKTTIYNAIDFARQYPEFSNRLENLNWKYISNYLLPGKSWSSTRDLTKGLIAPHALWTKRQEDEIEKMIIGRSINLCSGHSRLGDVKVDLYINGAIKEDATNTLYQSGEFDTVLCDPPYNKDHGWNHDLIREMGRLANQRIIFEHWFIPTFQGFRLEKIYLINPPGYFSRVRVLSVFDEFQAP